MTPEQMERAIEFLLDHHAKFSADIDQLKDSQSSLVESQARTSDTVDRLAGVVSELTNNVSSLADTVSRLEAQAESDRQETTEALDKLILANEVTRDLAAKATQLAISASQRITKLEEQT